MALDVDLDHLAEAVFVRFLCWKATLTSLLEVCAAHIWVKAMLPFPHLRFSININYLEFFCMRD